MNRQVCSDYQAQQSLSRVCHELFCFQLMIALDRRQKSYRQRKYVSVYCRRPLRCNKISRAHKSCLFLFYYIRELKSHVKTPCLCLLKVCASRHRQIEDLTRASHCSSASHIAARPVMSLQKKIS